MALEKRIKVVKGNSELQSANYAYDLLRYQK